MSASLVGSEMCIRDRLTPPTQPFHFLLAAKANLEERPARGGNRRTCSSIPALLISGVPPLSAS
eukprot:14584070-Alexandrium_andersonii.AAC.1